MKRLLTQFADRAVDGIPPADVDADVARGRRALRRIKARRRVTGVLCAAAVTTAVLAIGNQVKWWGGGETEVATGAEEASAPAAGADTDRSLATPAATPSRSDEGATTYSSSTIALVANQQVWRNIGCTLAPLGWTAEPTATAERVVLTPPSARTSDDVAAKLELRAAPQAQTLQAVRVTEEAGKVFHLGTFAGRETGQVMVGDTWLMVQLPVGTQEWNDDLLRRFLASCTVN
ncbi:hypothetical protein [Kribbella sancticallisti]|uniref:hypothetical protein n=1 Tax=Kribbella sancticallisti TaxID=460087 RepID=UPI0031D0B6C2